MRHHRSAARSWVLVVAVTALGLTTAACGAGTGTDREAAVNDAVVVTADPAPAQVAPAEPGMLRPTGSGGGSGAAGAAGAGVVGGPQATRTTTSPTTRPTTSTARPTTTPKPTATAGARRSGLPWASGVFPESYQAASSADEFGSWRGRPVDVAVVAGTRDSWDKLTKSVYLFDDDFFSSRWPGTVVVSMPFWPTGQGDMPSCAAGAYDEHFRDFGREVVAWGHPDVVVRLAWEMNGFFWEWSAHDPAQYVQCFRHVVTAVRGVAPKVRFDWTVNAYDQDTCGGTALTCYPGDAYVDIVGIDYYDKSPYSATAAEFAANARLPIGLEPMLAFAKAHGKKLSVSEWGVVSRNGAYARQIGLDLVGGDNPTYIEGMWAFFRAHANDLAYEAYLETCDAEAEVGSAIHSTSHCAALNPQAGARYRQLWSAGA